MMPNRQSQNTIPMTVSSALVGLQWWRLLLCSIIIASSLDDGVHGFSTCPSTASFASSLCHGRYPRSQSTTRIEDIDWKLNRMQSARINNQTPKWSDLRTTTTTSLGVLSSATTNSDDDETTDLALDDDSTTKKKINKGKSTLQEAILKWITLGAPLWTLVASGIGLLYPNWIGSRVGSLPSVSRSLSALMLLMGLSTTPQEVQKALVTRSSLAVLGLNALCCFLVMPLIAFVIPILLGCAQDTSIVQGTLLLGCVGGGQASNLFTLLAGGDVSLSVVCTLSTTILAALGATPAIMGLFLNYGRSPGSPGSLAMTSMDTNILGVLKSSFSLVLAPILAGLSLRTVLPEKLLKRCILPYCPALGVLLTILLVAGGAANSASSLLGSSTWKLAALCASLLPLAGGAVAKGIVSLCRRFLPTGSMGVHPKAERALVIEVLSKSPTVAYVLALKHLTCQGAAAVPAAGMVSLAVVGAAVASLWSLVPIPTEE